LGSVKELLRSQPEVAEPDAVVSAVGTKVSDAALHICGLPLMAIIHFRHFFCNFLLWQDATVTV
jgi:hypothetical protein